MTTKETISEWFDRGKMNGAQYLLVFCDTFDYSDYPSYAHDKQHALELKAKDGSAMRKLMEIYDLKQDKEKQIAQKRCMAL